MVMTVESMRAIKLRGKAAAVSLAALLAAALGMAPTVRVNVQDIGQLAIPDAMLEPVERMIDRALSHRPDLRAQVAELCAAEAQIAVRGRHSGPPLGSLGMRGPWPAMAGRIYSRMSAPAAKRGTHNSTGSGTSSTGTPAVSGWRNRSRLALKLKRAWRRLGTKRPTAFGWPTLTRGLFD